MSGLVRTHEGVWESDLIGYYPGSCYSAWFPIVILMRAVIFLAVIVIVVRSVKCIRNKIQPQALRQPRALAVSGAKNIRGKNINSYLMFPSCSGWGNHARQRICHCGQAIGDSSVVPYQSPQGPNYG
ncbi:hypothetical protein K474DRAFT_1673929 [Panus rudis PR-1116 ss-1]|nr:hypothetical protein K474DRAFT_1673929 [Panus rudis PR-1116 ss-1]